MNSRRRATVNAIAGVILAGGALSVILYWNYHPKNVARAVAPAPRAEQQADPVAKPQPSAPATTEPTSRPLPSLAAAQVLAQGHSLQSAGQLVEARKLVNDALIAGTFANAADELSAKAFLRELNDKLVFSPQPFANDPYADVVKIKRGDVVESISNQYLVPSDLILKINGLASANKLRVGEQLKVLKGPFHALVNKTAFTLDLYLGAPSGEGSMYVTTFRVGLGTNDSTPTGLWKPASKLRNPEYYSPRGEGIIPSGDPKNPLGHYWIGLTGVEGQAVGKRSYGIHGTIEPDSVGKQSSMGCIRLIDDDVAKVFIMLFQNKSTVRVVP